MTNRWRQVESLFHQAKELAENERAAFLDQACRGDVELRQEVESLLAQTTSDSPLWRPGALEEMTQKLFQNPSGIVQGDRLGAYIVVSLLGKGGMGEVYRARDTKLLPGQNTTSHAEVEARGVPACSGAAYQFADASDQLIPRRARRRLRPEPFFRVSRPLPIWLPLAALPPRSL